MMFSQLAKLSIHVYSEQVFNDVEAGYVFPRDMGQNYLHSKCKSIFKSEKFTAVVYFI